MAALKGQAQHSYWETVCRFLKTFPIHRLEKLMAAPMESEEQTSFEVLFAFLLGPFSDWKGQTVFVL